MSWTSGDIIAERFRLEELIGRGGMGAVYRATHLGLDRSVAVKLLLPEPSQNAEFRTRFEREAKVASRLEHENAVNVFDFGEAEGSLFLVMEMLSGVPLEKLVSAGPLALERVLHIGYQVADVLVTAHSMGLVHRDLKPGNIQIESRADGLDRPVLVDFGLAFIESDENLSRMTQDGIVSGTPQFISPEQAMGARDLGPASDIYSFGCVMHEMMTGESVFTAKSTVKLLNSHLFVPPTSMRVRFPELQIPAALDALVMSMLAKEPSDRPTADDVREWLATMLEKGDMRERGRPERLIDVRSRRAVTQSARRRETIMTPPSGLRKDVSLGTVAVVGETEASWVMSLNGAGYAVVAYSDEARGVVAIFAPDIEMEALDALLKTGIPVIAAADGGDLPRSTTLLKHGVSDVVTRPIEPSDLVRKVERAVRRHRRRK